MCICVCVSVCAAFCLLCLVHCFVTTQTNCMPPSFYTCVCVCVRVYSATFCGAISGLLRRTRASLLRTREMEALMR